MFRFLGAFAKLRKATISFVMSVRPSVCPIGTTWVPLDGIFMKAIRACFSRKCIEKIQVSLKCDKNNVYFIRRRFHIMTISRWIFFRMRNVLNKSCRENRNTHFMFSNFFFFFENRAIYEIMSKNTKPESPSVTIWRISLSCWVIKDTRAQTHACACAHTHTHTRKRAHILTHSVCNSYCFSTATMTTWTRLSVALHVHCLSCWNDEHFAMSHTVKW